MADLSSYRYNPRAIAFQGHRAIGRWRVKAHVITVRGTAAHFPDIVEAAWDKVSVVLGEAPDQGLDVGIAFVTLHLGVQGVWLLLDWWHRADMTIHRHFRAPFDDPTRFVDVGPEHLGPCVWEIAVAAHERQAWITHVLDNRAGADLDAYLDDGLTATM
ncbi:hypothetical protein LGH83_09440 [Lichenihabitans sp. PAMC28606]|uniref:hypothetical protein n=1 Tax=Lichenihabitans sp. PAMC28606 TaxID=2880932 RepID=UPI001D0B19D7|nr:hypothetical protein [Lichenihabitans sp. PAMC28606]UDL96373.1 hypothetical protein LGH83_09440 [Lichenihabitans sp. PAMC28606]